MELAATEIKTALHQLVVEHRVEGRFEIEFYDDIPVDELPLDLQAIVFPIVKELLQNACRHSRSKNVLVGLGQDEGRIYIQVQDWGVGFAMEEIHPHKVGIKAVRQLVQWREGTMGIDSRPGGGTCILVEFPLVRKANASDRKGRITRHDAHASDAGRL
jgi:two-component system sensor histidine kinase ComP